MQKPPWTNPSDAPVIEQSIHDYVVSIFSRVEGPDGDVEIIPISPAAEASRGYDAAVKQVVPLYFQYKLPDYTSRPAKSQPAVSAQRKLWNFDDSNGLFHFWLREKAPTAPKSQHQLLCDMVAAGERAYYVSTTFIDSRVLRRRGRLMGSRPYDDRYLRIGYLNELREVLAPEFHGLICIPPCCAVDDPPESHQFFFNDQREVSLHSDPIQGDALDLDDVIVDQIRLLDRGSGVTRESAEGYVAEILRVLSGGESIGDDYRLIYDYYRYFLGNEPDRPGMMRSLRALAKAVKNLYGVQMLLTAQLDPMP